MRTLTYPENPERARWLPRPQVNREEATDQPRGKAVITSIPQNPFLNPDKCQVVHIQYLPTSHKFSEAAFNHLTLWMRKWEPEVK